MTKQSDIKLSQFVHVVKNVLPYELCQEIVGEYKDDEHLDWSKVLKPGDDKPVIDYEQRFLKDLRISIPDSWLYNSKRVSILKRLEEATYYAVNEYFTYLTSESLTTCVPPIQGNEGFNLLYYKEGHKFDEHYDEMPNSGRLLTCSIALNETFEGGKFQFFNGSVTKELSAGDAILFPSSFLFPHAITPITLGERYSVITWLR